jgi:Domain of unknown function (DUF4260)
MRQLNILEPKFLLHLEGGTVLVGSALLYYLHGGNWLLYALLLLAPDLSMLGYMAGNKIGASIYNLIHTYPLPALLAAYGLLGNNPLALSLALIWSSHIGGDRLLGYGLKYPTEFKDTHLAHV